MLLLKMNSLGTALGAFFLSLSACPSRFICVLFLNNWNIAICRCKVYTADGALSEKSVLTLDKGRTWRNDAIAVYAVEARGIYALTDD